MKASDTWLAGSYAFNLTEPVIMGIVNSTPDSFYAGSRYTDRETAAERAAAMIADGALIIDIGGESTRPGASEISAAEEADRVLPVIEAVKALHKAAISIDTRKATVARQALAAGACIINDVSGLRDPGMAEVVATGGAGVVLMHMHGEPGTMQTAPLTRDEVLPVLAQYFRERLAWSERQGIPDDRIVIDPGLGFGKTYEANEAILLRLEELKVLSRPILIGVSRKGFIGNRTGGAVTERLFGSIAANVVAYMHGARIIRTHDVRATKEALAVTAAICNA